MRWRRPDSGWSGFHHVPAEHFKLAVLGSKTAESYFASAIVGKSMATVAGEGTTPGSDSSHPCRICRLAVEALPLQLIHHARTHGATVSECFIAAPEPAASPQAPRMVRKPRKL
jgi:hypothetical protein